MTPLQFRDQLAVALDVMTTGRVGEALIMLRRLLAVLNESLAKAQ